MGTISSARTTKSTGNPFLSAFEDCKAYGVIDGIENLLFHYSSDEIWFYPEELVGLTFRDALMLRYNRDLAFLRS